MEKDIFRCVSLHPSFELWRESMAPSVLLIHGKPAVLFNSILDVLWENTADPSAVVVSFCFEKHDIRRRTVIQLLVSLVQQILHLRPALYNQLEKVSGRWEASSSDPTQKWSESTMWNILQYILSCKDGRFITCIIQAPDESHNCFFRELWLLLDRTESPFKIAIIVEDSSNLWPMFHKYRFDIDLDATLEEDGVNDYLIDLVETRVLKRPVSRQTMYKIIEKCCSAHASFLWKRISLMYLATDKILSAPHILDSELDSLPFADPESFSERTLHVIPNSKHHWVHKALSWVIYAMRPLELHELAIILALETLETEFSSFYIVSDTLMEELSNNLTHLLPVFIEIRSTYLYLLPSEALDVILTSDSAVWYSMPEVTRLDLVQSCLRYLSIEEIQNARSYLDYSNLESVSLHLPEHVGYYFLRYAVLYWPLHYQSLSGVSPSYDHLILSFLRNHKFTKLWIELFWALQVDPVTRDRYSYLTTSPLIVASQFGFVGIVQILLGSEASVINGTEVDLSLEAAARHGHIAIVNQLTRSKKVSTTAIERAFVTVSGSPNEYIALELTDHLPLDPAIDNLVIALNGASGNGNFKVVQRILSQWSAVVTSKPDKLTALHDACQIGSVPIVCLLLKHGFQSTRTDTADLAPLHMAAIGGHVRIIELLLASGADVDAQSLEGITPIYFAARNGYFLIVRELLFKGADPDKANARGRTPLHLACMNGFLKTAQALIKGGANVSMLDQKGNTPLQLAIACSHINIIELLIQTICSTPGNISLNAPNSSDRTPLMLAIQQGLESVALQIVNKDAGLSQDGSLDPKAFFLATEKKFPAIITTCLQRGGDPNIRNDRQMTPLHVASKHGHLEIVQILLEAHADIMARDEEQKTALHFAAERGHNQVVQLLLSYQADLTTVDAERRTILHAACVGRNAKIVEELLKHESLAIWDSDDSDFTALELASGLGLIQIAKLILQHDAHITPSPDGPVSQSLVHAANYGHKKTVELLLDAGANKDYQDCFGNSALSLAAWNNCLDIAILLLIRKVRLNLRDEHGNTPLHDAAHRNSVEVLKVLLKAGAEREAKNKKRLTPLMRAVAAKNTEAVRVLLEKGADIRLRFSETQSLIDSATMSGWTIFKLFVDHGVDFNSYQGYWGSLLHVAAMSGQLKIVQFLLERGLDVNCVSGICGTALQSAATYGQAEVTKYLVENSADVNLVSGRLGTALSVSMIPEGREIAFRLLHYGADVTIPRGYYTGLLGVLLVWTKKSLEDTIAMATDLLKKGASKDARDVHGRMPIHFAAYKGSLSLVKKLTSGKASLDSRDKQRRTGFHYAASRGSLDIIRKILDGRENCDVEDADGWTPLLWACRQSNPAVIKTLLQHGADAFHSTPQGWTAKRVAYFHNQTEIFDLLNIGTEESSVAEQDNELSTGSGAEEDEEDEIVYVKGQLHEDCYCESCFLLIYGHRYKCKVCLDYSYCFKCYWTVKLTHDPSHEFSKP